MVDGSVCGAPFYLDHAASGSGWQDSALRCSHESCKDDDYFVYAFRHFKRQAATL